MDDGAMKNMQPLTDEQCIFARNCVGRWMDICEETGYIKENGRLTGADAGHSALLGRLLSGKEPTPLPPPLACSYPWYELEEGKRCAVMKFMFHKGEKFVNMNNSQFKIVSWSGSSGIVEWEKTEQHYIVELNSEGGAWVQKPNP